jgi:2-dehydropantoate 2-reductase
MRTAILGAGSIGTIIGAMLSREGLDVTLVDANRSHVDELNAGGARVVGSLDFRCGVKACPPEGMTGIYDLVIYTVKSTFDGKALPVVLPHIGEASTFITLQNGIPEEKVASFIGRERVLGGAVGWGATWQSPGTSELTSPLDKMTYDIGELDGTITGRLQGVKSVLDHAGTAIVTQNLAGIRWTKLLANASLSGMSAALGCSYGEILDNDRALTAALYIIIETILTSRAAGVTMEPMLGVNPLIILDIVKQDIVKAKGVMNMVWGTSRNLKASMLQDLEKGLACEVESINGHLSAASARVGIPTPVNDAVTEMIRDIQAGRKKLAFSNLEDIELPGLETYLRII